MGAGFRTKILPLPENSWLSLVNASAEVKPIPLTQEDELTLEPAVLPSFKVNRRLTIQSASHRSLAKGKSKKSITSRTEISEAKELVNWDNVQISRDEIYLPFRGMGLDFGGFGKEFAVDKVSEKLKNLNLKMVDFRGDISLRALPKKISHGK